MIIEEIRTMIHTGRINSWLRRGDMKVYVRIGRRFLELGSGLIAHNTIEIANVKVTNRGRGTFRNFVAEVEGLAFEEFHVLYIENVYNKRLADFFRDRKYHEIRQMPGLLPTTVESPSSFWKRP